MSPLSFPFTLSLPHLFSVENEGRGGVAIALTTQLHGVPLFDESVRRVLPQLHHGGGVWKQEGGNEWESDECSLRRCPTRLRGRGLTVDGDIDAAGLDGPDGSWNKEADLTGEVSVFVLFQHFVHQCTLNRVEPAGLPGHQHQHVDLYRVRREGPHVYRPAPTDGKPSAARLVSNSLITQLVSNI